MTNKLPYYGLAGSLSISLVIMFNTKPKNSPALLLVVMFLSIYVALLTTYIICLKMLGSETVKTIYVGAIVLTAPVIVLALKSIGQARIIDTLLLTVSVSLIGWLVSKKV